MKSPPYRIFHRPSNSDALLIFSWENGQVKQFSLIFTRGNIIDLVKYKQYKKHAKASFESQEAQLPNACE